LLNKSPSDDVTDDDLEFKIPFSKETGKIWMQEWWKGEEKKLCKREKQHSELFFILLSISNTTLTFAQMTFFVFV